MTKVKMLDKSAILGAEDLPTELVEVPEWGGAVMVRGLTGRQLDAWQTSFVDPKSGKQDVARMVGMRASLISRTIVDEEGKLLFGPNDVQALGEKSALALDRVFEVAQRLSGIGQIEELVENFTPDLNGDSPSV